MNEGIRFAHKNGRIICLKDEAHETCWISKVQSIAQFGTGDNSEIDKRFSIEQDEGKVWLEMRLENRAPFGVYLEADFPSLVLDRGDDDISYCFASLNPILGSEPIELEISYSTWYPMQFMSFWNDKNTCLTLVGMDEDNLSKKFILNKSAKGIVNCAVRYQMYLEQGQQATLRAVLAVDTGDWHQGLETYKELWQANYECSHRDIGWLHDAYLFRQWFMHKNYDEPVFDEETKTFKTAEKFEDDASMTGPIDYVQIFDWAYEPRLGRLGRYSPWEYLQGKRDFAEMLDYLHSKGTHTGLYFEGYLMGRNHPFALDIAEKAHLRNADNLCYSYAGDEYYALCPADGDWRKWLQSCIRGTVNRLSGHLDAIYIDEYCCGEQFPCCSLLHEHAKGDNQIQREHLFLQELRDILPHDTAILTEYFPSDGSIALLDASLTYANPLVNLSRFAFPGFRQFVIIKCDEPLHNDVAAAKRIFFNGQGIWLSGNLHDEEWFGNDFLKFVKKMLGILRNNPEFSSLKCTPLLYGKNNDICINAFWGDHTVIWTLYNVSEKSIDREYPLPSGMEQVYDIWQGKKLSPSHGKISVSLDCGEVGCIKFSAL